MLRLMWQSGEGTVIGEVAGKPIRKRQRFDMPSSCHFPNSLRGDGPGLAGKWAEQLPWDHTFSNCLSSLQTSRVYKAARRISWSINKPYLSLLSPSPSALGKAFSRIQTTREISEASAGWGDRGAQAVLRDVGGGVVHVWTGQDLERRGLGDMGKLRPGSPVPFQLHSAAWRPFALFA